MWGKSIDMVKDFLSTSILASYGQPEGQPEVSSGPGIPYTEVNTIVPVLLLHVSDWDSLIYILRHMAYTTAKICMYMYTI